MTPLGLLELHLRQGHPDFLDMPWSVGVGEWDGVCPRLVELPRGISRHDVRFAAWGATACSTARRHGSSPS